MVRSAVLGNNDIAKLIFWSLTIPDLCRVERVSAWLRVAASTDETFRLALESLLAPAVASLEEGAKHVKQKADKMDPVEEGNDDQPPVMCGHTLSEARTSWLSHYGLGDDGAGVVEELADLSPSAWLGRGARIKDTALLVFAANGAPQSGVRPLAQALAAAFALLPR